MEELTTQNDKKSLGMIIGSMLIFGTIGVFRRYIPLSSTLLATYRGLAGSLFLTILVVMFKKKPFDRIGQKQLLTLIISGIMIGVNWILLFESYNYTSVATATLCYYMEPTFVILAAPVFFRERLTIRKMLCAIVAVIGMIFVSGVSLNNRIVAGELKGVLYGLAAAALYAAVVMFNKSLKGVNPFGKTIIQLFTASVSLIPYLIITWQPLDIVMSAKIYILLFVVGFGHTGLAYALYFGSMDGLKVQTCAIVSYIDPVFAVILSAVLLKEPLGIKTIIGAVLILGAAFVSEIA